MGLTSICLANEYPIPKTVNTANIEKVASVGLERNQQFYSKMPAQKSAQPGIGKFANSKKNDPTINNGIEIKNPSRMANKYLLFPIFFKGINTRSNTSIIIYHSILYLIIFVA